MTQIKDMKYRMESKEIKYIKGIEEKINSRNARKEMNEGN